MGVPEARPQPNEFSNVAGMAHPSTAAFRVFHALRIKGVATADTLAELTGLDGSVVDEHVAAFAADGLARFREARALWQLTPAGRDAHPARLAADLAGTDAGDLAETYRQFLQLNATFKTLCGDWQLRDGAANDHNDASYDAAVIERLSELHGRVRPVVEEVARRIERFGPYPERLTSALARVVGGESNMFTGVMCGSYHDVWMELHEDLILTQGIDRTAEGSF